MRFELRASPRLIQLIAQTERLIGRLERIFTALPETSLACEQDLVLEDVRAAFLLDASTPVDLSLCLEKRGNLAHVSQKGQDLYRAFVEAYAERFEFDLIYLLKLAGRLSSSSFIIADRETHGVARNGRDSTVFSEGALCSQCFRVEPVHFSAPARFFTHQHGEEIIFPTVRPFLVHSRLQELTEWCSEEFEVGTYHPLVIIGLFHLMFLQIHPFPQGNHRLSLLFMWHLLRARGYSFVGSVSLASLFERRAKVYFASLRQAERTAGADWSSTAVWLEFFVESLLETTRRFWERVESTDRGLSLTPLQKRIVDVVRSHGRATREKVAQETGVNLSTVKYNLSVLSRRGHLKREGGGRTTSYRVL